MKKQIYSTFIIVLFTLIFKGVAIAVPTYPNQIEVMQSDKTILSIFLKGDEKYSWAKTLDGYILLRAKNGDFVYAVSDIRGGMQPSEILAHNEDLRSKEEINFIKGLDKNIFYSKQQIEHFNSFWNFKQSEEFVNAANLAKSTNREIRVVVLLVQYQDKAFVNNAEYFNKLFNQVGYNTGGNEGSIRDYILASTFGQVGISSDVYGPFTASGNASDYAHQTVGHIGARNLIGELINLADPVVNFANYCSNNSNIVDCIYMVYAGCPASSGEPNAIWPHRSVVYPPVQKDGVTLYNYACSSELGGTTAGGTTPPPIGTICHEFSHVLQLEDVYDTDYDSNGQAITSRYWDVMDMGCYNNGGKTPPLWSSYQRSSQNFLTPIELASQLEKITLPPLNETNIAYKISFSPTEYFLLENRQQEGWDRYVGGHGMIITHIDRTLTGINPNQANCNPNNMGIDLVEANNSPYYPSGNPFPGTTNNTSFTDSSNPNSHSKSDAMLNKPLKNIIENSVTKNIVFDFGNIPANSPKANTNSITRLTPDSICVSITVSQTTDAITEKGLVYSLTPFPTQSDTKLISTSSQNNFILAITNIQASTTYYIRAYVKNAGGSYFYGEIIKVDVPCQAIKDFPYKYSFEDATEDLPLCWSDNNDSFFNNRWKITDTAETISSINSGDKFAFIYSSSQTGQNAKLITPVFDISNLSQPYIKFQYMNKKRGTNQDVLKVYYRKSSIDNWILMKTYSNNTPSWTMDSIALPNKSKTYYIAFEANLNNGYGILVDNIKVSEANLASFPVVSTIGANNINDISAQITSNITSMGSTPITARGVVYGLMPNPTLDNSYVYSTAGLGQYIVSLNNLESNKVYYIRSFAKNENLIAYGNEISIITKCERISSFPHSFNLDATDTICFEKEAAWELISQDQSISANSGEKFYTFNPQSNSISKLIIPLLNLNNYTSAKIKFYYQKPNAIAVLKVLYRIGENGDWVELGTYSNNTSLWTLDSIALPNPSDNYYIAFEGNSQNNNAIYIDDISIDAILQIPIVQTLSATLLNYNTIQVSANVVYSGLSSVTERGISYTTNGNIPTINDSKIVTGQGLGLYTSMITNIEPEKVYKIRAYAINSYGTSYGNLLSIVSPPTPILNNIIADNQELCYNSVTQSLQGSTPSGGNGQFEYLWLESIDNIQWDTATDRDFAIQQTYYPYRAIHTSYFKRVVYSRNVTDTSNTILIKVYPLTKGGNVFRLQDTIMQASTLKMELRAFEGTILTWERKKLNFNWEELPDSKDSVLLTDKPIDWGMYYYRAKVKSGVCQEMISGQDWTYVKKGIGLDELEEENNNRIVISPNPSKGEISILMNRDFIGDIKIYDINSKEVKSYYNKTLIKGENKLNLNPINNGSYLLLIKNKENKIIQRVIIINK